MEKKYLTYCFLTILITLISSRNILAIPLFNSENDILGVIQLLNKEGKFSREDINIAYFVAKYISPALERLLSKHKSLKIKSNNDYII